MEISSWDIYTIFIVLFVSIIETKETYATELWGTPVVCWWWKENTTRLSICKYMYNHSIIAQSHPSTFPATPLRSTSYMFWFHTYVVILCIIRFTRKAPLCITPRETASLFHEIGNCFLVLNNFRGARDAGRKSLKAAEAAGNIQQQLQACVLVGLAEGTKIPI